MTPTPLKRKRVMLMLNAYLTYYARREPQSTREWVSWAFLLEWASLGGKPDEVIGETA